MKQPREKWLKRRTTIKVRVGNFVCVVLRRWWRHRTFLYFLWRNADMGWILKNSVIVNIIILIFFFRICNKTTERMMWLYWKTSLKLWSPVSCMARWISPLCLGKRWGSWHVDNGGNTMKHVKTRKPWVFLFQKCPSFRVSLFQRCPYSKMCIALGKVIWDHMIPTSQDVLRIFSNFQAKPSQFHSI